jgi:hypothetical protein
MRPADRGDRAEAALVVAAVADAQVGVGARRGQQARALLFGPAQAGRGQVGRTLATVHQIRHTAGQLAVVADLREHVDIGEAPAQAVAVALHQATGHDHTAQSAGGLAFQLGADRRVGFFARRPDERAGVDHHHLGLVGVAGDEQARFGHARQDQLGVDQVARAAQVDQGHTGGLDGSGASARGTGSGGCASRHGAYDSTGRRPRARPRGAGAVRSARDHTARDHTPWTTRSQASRSSRMSRRWPPR